MTDQSFPWQQMGPSWDRDGNAINFEEWARILHEDEGHGSYGIVGQTVIGEHVAEVSTVWIGRNLTIGANPPLIFETMIFAERMNCNHDQMRSATYPEAFFAHGVHVGRVLIELGVPIVAALDVGAFAVINDAEMVTTNPSGKIVAWKKRERKIPRPVGATMQWRDPNYIPGAWGGKM